jgi:hypothetical protein
LVLDLDGDGVETLGTDSAVFFDHDNNGFAENSGWISSDDGILVRDLNDNGVIDSGAELFGNNTILEGGEAADNGFEALADLDSNHDGVFDGLDDAFGEVKVWKDADSDGVTDTGELLSLNEAGVTSINLSYTNTNTTDENNNQHLQAGSYTITDDTTAVIEDVWFDADKARTLDNTEIEISEEIAALPNVLGFGNVHNLQTAMALDEIGRLKSLVEQYAATNNYSAVFKNAA